MADQITLSIPNDPSYRPVAAYVLGGLAARLDLTVENLEDFQLALDVLLARIDGPLRRITLELTVGENALVARVGPLGDTVLAELERGVEERGGEEHEVEGLGIRRVLDSTVDDVLVDGDCAVLTKAVSLAR